MEEDDLIGDFDALARQFGYPDATGIRAREKRIIMERLRRMARVDQKQFQASIMHALVYAQQRVERGLAAQRRHEQRSQAKKLAKKIECDVLASLSKPVSRTAGRAEHLMVLANLPADRFFRTPEWRRTRWEALHLYGRRCCSCGAVPEDEARLTATHIVSRLVAPAKAFDLSNLRILCVDCHVGRRALGAPHHA